MSGWTEADSEHHIGGFQTVRTDFTLAFSRDLPADCDEVRGIARRMYALLNEVAPKALSKTGFLNIIKVYAEHRHLRSSLEAQALGLTDYVVAAMRAFSAEIV